MGAAFADRPDLEAMTSQHHRQVGNGVKGQALLLDFTAPAAPQLFADALHIVPHADGTVAVGSTSERAFDDPQSVDAQLDAVYARFKIGFGMAPKVGEVMADLILDQHNAIPEAFQAASNL